MPDAGIDHAAVPDEIVSLIAIIRSSTAIRTAMPFSTWFRITERCESATSDEISRPRLIGPGMHHDDVGLGQVQVLQPQPVELEVLARRERRLVLPLELHAQHHDDVGVADGLADVVSRA